MFALVHFSRVFPFVHPYLFPVEPAASSEQRQPSSAAALPGGDVGEGALPERLLQARRLKRLYRRRQLQLGTEGLTYSGLARQGVR